MQEAIIDERSLTCPKQSQMTPATSNLRNGEQSAPAAAARCPDPSDLGRLFREVRKLTREIVQGLQPEDCVLQSMPDASPVRWHLAHTTWFFETFVLKRAVIDYRPVNPHYEFLFNSYYDSLGAQFPRPQRGLLSRPTVAEVWHYRDAIEQRISSWLETEIAPQLWETYGPILQIGIQHEQQHQELILTDIKHAFSLNPLQPSITASVPSASSSTSLASSSFSKEASWWQFPGGLQWLGYDGKAFAYDNESPRHQTFLQPFAIAKELTTNGQYLEFIEAGGYKRSEYWLSLGWSTCQAEQWQTPLYWYRHNDQWWHYTLHGPQPIDLAAPVSHISFFEADAYARWANCRLPSEAEWELLATQLWDDSQAHGSYAEGGVWQPTAAATRCLFGVLWQWTESPYRGYPGYRPPQGAIGEYNGKFMCNQFVLRGGSIATPRSHLRPTYRNFFPPAARWQFSGLRLAKEIGWPHDNQHDIQLDPRQNKC